jgi:hypothetical protein
LCKCGGVVWRMTTMAHMTQGAPYCYHLLESDSASSVC